MLAAAGVIACGVPARQALHIDVVAARTVEIVELRTGGTVLGLFPEVEYQEAHVDLHPGDLLVAFTDGVPEALNAEGEEFGEERLKELLQRSAGATAEDISARLVGRMQEWIGAAEQHDDLTFVVAR